MTTPNTPYQDPDLRRSTKDASGREDFHRYSEQDNGDERAPNPAESSRERMGMAYDDEDAPLEYDRRPKPGLLGDILPAGLSASKVIYGLLGVIGVVVAAFGLSSVFVSHKGGIPVFGPPALPVKVKPVNPGGMQASGMMTVGDVGNGKVILAPPPETAHPEQLSSQYNKLAATQKSVGSDDSFSEEIPPTEGKDMEASGKTKAVDQPETKAGSDTAKTAEDTTKAASEGSGAEKSAAHQNQSDHDGAVGKKDADIPAITKEKPGKTESSETKAPPKNKENGASLGDEKSTSSLHKGKYAVQLGALNSMESAQKLWEQLKLKAPNLMQGRIPVIQKISHDGKTFYRLRTKGFVTSGQASEFCSQISSKGGSCTVANF